MNGEFNKEVWYIPPKPYPDHPAPFPEKLVYEAIINTTDENDLVLDPYFGSGTVGVVCVKNKRNFIGIEQSLKYCKIAESRIIKECGILYEINKNLTSE